MRVFVFGARCFHCHAAQSTATPRNPLPRRAIHCHAAQSTATQRNPQPRRAAHCHAVQPTATLRNPLPRRAAHCHAAQPSATPRGQLPRDALDGHAAQFTATPRDPLARMECKRLCAMTSTTMQQSSVLRSQQSGRARATFTVKTNEISNAIQNVLCFIHFPL